MNTINTRKPHLPEDEEDQYRYCWIQFKRAESVSRDWDFYFYMGGQLTRMTNKQYGRAGCRTAFQKYHVRTHLYYEHVYRCLMFLVKEKDFDFEKIIFLTDDEKIFYALNEQQWDFGVYEQCSYKKGKPLRELMSKKCHVIYNPEPSKEWEKINSVGDVLSLNTLKAPQPKVTIQGPTFQDPLPESDTTKSPLLNAQAKLDFFKNRGQIRMKEETAEPEYCWIVSRSIHRQTHTYYHYRGETHEWEENDVHDSKAKIERDLLAHLSQRLEATTFVTTYPYTAHTVNGKVRVKTGEQELDFIRENLSEKGNRLVALSNLSSSFDKKGYAQMIRDIDQLSELSQPNLSAFAHEEIDLDEVRAEIRREERH